METQNSYDSDIERNETSESKISPRRFTHSIVEAKVS